MSKVTDTIEPDDWWAIHKPTGQKIGVLPGYIRSITIDHPDAVELRIHQVSQIPLLRLSTCHWEISKWSMSFLDPSPWSFDGTDNDSEGRFFKFWCEHAELGRVLFKEATSDKLLIH